MVVPNRVQAQSKTRLNCKFAPAIIQRTIARNFACAFVQFTVMLQVFPEYP